MQAETFRGITGTDDAIRAKAERIATQGTML